MFEMRMTQHAFFLNLKLKNTHFQMAINKYYSIQQHLTQ